MREALILTAIIFLFVVGAATDALLVSATALMGIGIGVLLSSYMVSPTEDNEFES